MPTSCWRFFNAAAVVALTAWVGYDALGTNVFGSKPLTETMVDFHIQREQSVYLVTHKSYDPESMAHAYPPSAAILIYAASHFPLRVATGIWLALSIGSALGSLWVL